MTTSEDSLRFPECSEDIVPRVSNVWASPHTRNLLSIINKYDCQCKQMFTTEQVLRLS